MAEQAYMLSVQELISVYEEQHEGWTLRVMSCGHLQARKKSEVERHDDAQWACQICWKAQRG